MRIALMAGVLAVAGCSSGADTVCGQACEQLQRCGVDRIHITSVKSYGYDRDCAAVACDAITACVSRCIGEVDCLALQTVVLDGPLHRCLATCSSFFRADGG